MLKIHVNRYILQFVLCICFISVGTVLNAQVKKDALTVQREKILKEIEYTSKLLRNTKIKRGKNVNQVQLISQRLNQRERLIKNLNKEIRNLEIKLKDRNQSILKLKDDLAKQKRRYAEFILYSYKNHNHYSIAVYLLASNSFNQFYLRKKYLEQLRKARLEKIELIGSIEKKIKEEIILIGEEKQKKLSTVKRIESEKSKLTIERRNKRQVIKELLGEEDKLKKELKERKKVEEEIARKLEEIIKKEAEKSRFASPTPENSLVSANFERNMGKLPWPTRQGIITAKFGVHYHPVMKNIKLPGNGIDITTVQGEAVRCIFNGKVSSIFKAGKGVSYTVIVTHGSYRTVYHNLYDLAVNIGDNVTTKQVIGKVSKNRNGDNAKLHFQIWKNMQKLDPERWISN